MAGETIGGYTILRRICQTASSELFLASDMRRRREVALKVVLPHLARDKAVLAQYDREAEVSEHLDHPGVVKVYEFVAKAERPYLVMNYIPGHMLKTVIYQRTDAVLKRGFHWIVRMAEGLGHMHARGWLHMDVKPENALVQGDGKASLIDLALARAMGKPGLFERMKRRMGGQTAGTRSYMSPEQILGNQVEPTSDIYSLGILIFEMFARRLPLTASDPDAILQLHLKAKPPMLHHVVPQIHPELSQLVGRMLAKQPEARPQTMDAVIDALVKIRRPVTGKPEEPSRMRLE